MTTLVGPHAVTKDMYAAYKEMAADTIGNLRPWNGQKVPWEDSLPQIQREGFLLGDAT
jgi:hypothetical protein